MKLKTLFFYAIATANHACMYGTYNDTNPLLYLDFEPEYPSYVARNKYGLCLRARKALEPNTIVGTAHMVSSPAPYIHDHPNITYRHVSIIGFKSKQPVYGRVIGKYAFCNHSCEPNCIVTKEFLIKTQKPLQRHEEITLAYDAYIPYLPWQQQWSFDCYCSTPRCRKKINEYRGDIIHPASYNKH